MSILCQLLPNIRQQFRDANGNLLVGGKLYSYAAGTTTKLATYTDQTANTANTNPVILDSSGSASVWISTAGYKLVLKDANDNVQWSVDQVYLIPPNSIGAAQIADGAVGTSELADNSVTTAKIQTGAITTDLIATGAITTGKIAAEAITIDLIDPAIDLSNLDNVIEIVFKRSDDYSGARLSAIPQVPWVTPQQQLNPGTLPTDQGNATKWSPDGHFLSVAHKTSPYVTIYEKIADTLNKLADPATLPTGDAASITWSPNGDFLVVCHATTPFITIYQRQGNTFTKLSNPGTLPASAGVCASFSPNGEFLAVSSSTDFQLYQISGTTFTSIVSSSGISSPDGTNGAVTWSSDSRLLALTNGSGTGNVFSCYQRAGVSFSAATISAQPSSAASALAFTPDGAHLIGGFSGTNYVFQYDISGTTLTLSSSPFVGSSIPAGAVVGVAISPNGRMIAVVSATSPYLQIYIGDFTNGFTLQSNPADLPAGACNGISIGPTNQWLAVAVNISPFVQTYLSSGALPSTGVLYSRTASDV